MQRMLQAVDVHLFVAFETNQIMTVALVVAHEQILAVSAFRNLAPPRQSFLYGKQRGMLVYFIRDSIFGEEIEHPQTLVFAVEKVA